MPKKRAGNPAETIKGEEVPFEQIPAASWGTWKPIKKKKAPKWPKIKGNIQKTDKPFRAKDMSPSRVAILKFQGVGEKEAAYTYALRRKETGKKVVLWCRDNTSGEVVAFEGKPKNLGLIERKEDGDVLFYEGVIATAIEQTSGQMRMPVFVNDENGEPKDPGRNHHNGDGWVGQPETVMIGKAKG